MLHTFAVYVDNKPGVLNRVVVAVPAPRVQHRVADGRPHRDAGRLAHDGRRRHRRVRRAPARGAPLQAGAVPARRQHHVGAVDLARSGADQGRRHRRSAHARHAARRRLPRAHRRRQPRVAGHRDDRHRRQDRQPGRSAAAVRRDRDGPHRPRRDGARHAPAAQRAAPRPATATPTSAATSATVRCRTETHETQTRNDRCGSCRVDESSFAPFVQARDLRGDRLQGDDDGDDVLRRRRRPCADSGAQGRDYRLRIAGARARAEPEGQRRQRPRRPAGDQPLAREGAGRRA